MRNRGQALIELAIFGSLIIMVLGVMINYGLNNDYTQQAMMKGFRMGLETAPEAVVAGKPTSVSHTVLDDRHIPSPSNPFGTGQVASASGSGNVTRSHRLELTADTEEELSRMTMTLQGSPIDCPSVGDVGCTTQGFRVEDNVHPDAMKRYEEIYGASNLCANDKCVCGVDAAGVDIPCGTTGVCAEAEILNPSGEFVCPGGNYFKRVKIIDSCEGEMIDFKGCAEQARLMVDKTACQLYCKKGQPPSSKADCTDICDADMNLPWYAQGAVQTASDDGGTAGVNEAVYKFPNLEALFTANGLKALGLAVGFTKATGMQHGLDHQNTSGQASSDTTVDWSEQTTRQFYHRNPATNEPEIQDTTTTVEEHTTTQWDTTW